MQRFILEIVIFALISILCLKAFGIDEDMVWDEDKKEWVFTPVDKPKRKKTNKKQKPTDWVIGSRRKKERKRPGPFIYTEEWEKYLPIAVKRGLREATNSDIHKAKRKCELKYLRMLRSEYQKVERQQKKINNQYIRGDGLSWPMRMHVESVNSFLRQGY